MDTKAAVRAVVKEEAHVRSEEGGENLKGQWYFLSPRTSQLLPFKFESGPVV